MVELTRKWSRRYARLAEAKLAQCDADIVLGPHFFTLAQLKCRQPLTIWGDSTFAGLHNFYADYTNLCAASVRDGHAAEQAAQDRCAAVLYASDWAAQTAIERYHADPKKVHVTVHISPIMRFLPCG